MRNIFRCLVPICVLALVFGTSAVGQSQQHNVEQQLNTILAENNGVGLAVAVVKDNQLVYSNGFGYSDMEAKTPLRADHIFRIASISKSFTASALMQLVEQGALSLQDDVSDLIGFPVVNPKFPDETITLAMILSHTSSMNDSGGYFTLDVINPSTTPTYAKSYSDYPPGTRYSYCNMGYNLAGAILERLSQRRFDMVVQEQILQPLGMEAGYHPDLLDRSRYAALYEYKKANNSFTKSEGAYRSPNLEDYLMGYSAPVFSPTGGLKVSALDLAKYMQMHMNYGIYQGSRVLSEPASALMQKPYIKGQEATDYGLGLRRATDIIEGETMVGHTGSAYGLRSAMFFEPDKKFGFVVISNGMDTSREQNGYVSLMKQAIDALYNHFIKEGSSK